MHPNQGDEDLVQGEAHNVAHLHYAPEVQPAVGGGDVFEVAPAELLQILFPAQAQGGEGFFPFHFVVGQSQFVNTLNPGVEIRGLEGEFLKGRAREPYDQAAAAPAYLFPPQVEDAVSFYAVRRGQVFHARGENHFLLSIG